jgi:hypothetical protein
MEALHYLQGNAWSLIIRLIRKRKRIRVAGGEGTDAVPKQNSVASTPCAQLPCSLDFARNSRKKDLAHSRKIDSLFSIFCGQRGEDTRHQDSKLDPKWDETQPLDQSREGRQASHVRRDPLQRALESADRGPSLLNRGVLFPSC